LLVRAGNIKNAITVMSLLACCNKPKRNIISYVCSFILHKQLQ
jgi:hypothetical protein